jgi:hypothetical protein
VIDVFIGSENAMSTYVGAAFATAAESAVGAVISTAMYCDAARIASPMRVPMMRDPAAL